MTAVAGLTKTHCPYCSLQCGITLDASTAPVSLAPQDDFPTNLGGLCAKGWTAAELLDHPQRLTEPMVRDARGEPLRPTDWDDALDRIAAAFIRTQRAYGPDSVGCFGGGGLTNEKAYQFGKFARVALGTSAIDYNGRFCMSSAANAATRAFGIDRGLPFPLADLAEADAVLLVGIESGGHDAAGDAVSRHRPRPGRPSHRDRPADNHDGAWRCAAPAARSGYRSGPGQRHVAHRDPGEVDRRGLHRRAHHRFRCGTPCRAAVLAGPGGAHHRRARAGSVRCGTNTGAAAEHAIVLTARGAEQHRSGSDTVIAFINLALALGLPGRRFSGYGTVTGQGNGQGGREHGQKADQLPGYRRLDDPLARAHVAEVWGIDADDLPQPGLSAYEMLDHLGGDGGVRALLVIASNIVVSAPRSAHIAERIRALDFLVVSDIFMSETAAMADVVLPTTQWAEEAGTMTNLEGRVILREAGVAPPAGVRTDLQVMRRTRRPAGYERVLRRPRRGLHRASARQRGRQGRLFGDQLSAYQSREGCVLALPIPDTSRHATLIHRGLPDQGSARPLSSGGTDRRR